MVTSQNRTELDEDTELYIENLNYSATSDTFIIVIGLYSTSLIRAMLTKAFLARASTEESNKTLLEILNNLPEAIFLLKKGQNTVRHETIENQMQHDSSIKCLE